MKFSTVAIAVLLGRPTGIFAMDTEPTPNQLTFKPDTDVSISIRRFNDDRVQAFRLVTRDLGDALTSSFTSDGRLTSFRVTLEEDAIDERFRVNYNAQTGDILGFIPTEIGMPTPQDLPAPFACDECEMVRDDVCDFINNFCNDLPEQGLFSELTDLALIELLCDNTRRVLCAQASADEVCSETCIVISVPWPV